jgi:hypothetical protein
MSHSKCTDKIAEIQKVFEEIVTHVNDVCKFSKRNTPLNAERFAEVLVLGWLQKGDASLNDLADFAGELGVKITGSAINERLGQAAVDLLRETLVQAIRYRPAGNPIPIGLLELFTAIHVTDSTQIDLPQSLYDLFTGGNGDAKVKLQVTLDYLTGQWVALEFMKGKSSDQKSDLPLTQAIVGSLNIFDLGYFKQERLRDIDRQDAYFVCRCQSQIALYHYQTCERIELVQHLQSLTANEYDGQMLLGGRVKLSVRLVARRLPKKVADARRRKAKKKYQGQGKTCSATYLYLLSWDILVTNIPPEQLTLSQIFELYPIRMQIEWVFRVWKSQLQVDHFGNWRTHRVLCQLYAHLTGILLCHRFTAGWLWYDGQEHSFSKCVQIIQKRIGGLMQCIKRHWYGIHAWIHRLEDSFKQFGRKTKRKKEPSTLQILREWSLS